jgi:hypothetical protein
MEYVNISIITIQTIIQCTAVLMIDIFHCVDLPGQSFSACDLHGATLGGNVTK